MIKSINSIFYNLYKSLMKTLNQKLFEIKKLRITLTRDTKAYNYKYATLDQIQEKINPLLEEHNLLVTHYINNNELCTKITNLDDDKDFVVSCIWLWELLKAQDKWSAITYYRRYNLLSLFDLEVEDDDWAKASQVKENHLPIPPKNRVEFLEKQYDSFTKEYKKHLQKYPTAESIIKMLDVQYILSDEYKNKIVEFYKTI